VIHQTKERVVKGHSHMEDKVLSLFEPTPKSSGAAATSGVFRASAGDGHRRPRIFLRSKRAGGRIPGSEEGAAAGAGTEVKQAVAEEVKAQLAAEQATAGQRSSGAQQSQSNGDEVPPALDPARRTFVVSADLAVDGTDNQECSLTQGDVLMRMGDTPDSNQKASVSVASSKNNDCAAGKQITVAVDDLQEMRNRFQEQLDDGMKELASKQGTGNMPKAPDTNTVASDVPPPPPDTTALTNDLQQQQASADQTESEVKKEAFTLVLGEKCKEIARTRYIAGALRLATLPFS
jgi:hypothetical protein